jgi:hypothetical protein
MNQRRSLEQPTNVTPIAVADLDHVTGGSDRPPGSWQWDRVKKPDKDWFRSA